ncbi:hypothetical protein CCC_04066 [Paramagnetospirillum magnetotacticum MS-1]|uniref:PRC-barrel domain-containing protein n=1 Tax=Paramagnetospirillum magnetotacticum MS-1 TaxID=272627 RepID=A0A0C2YXZ9_PARME|nr:hypothetical protein [Paramagnetospirillum magnetotacticum]KIL99550.1 hypothetical protein CCC_04066 [Paramagnetospirillum magnetotacticum MS-1]
MRYPSALAVAVLALLIAARVFGADLPAVGTRTIGNQHYLVDRNGNTVGQLKELSPGNWHVVDTRGMTVGTVTGSPGVPPVVTGPVRR